MLNWTTCGGRRTIFQTIIICIVFLLAFQWLYGDRIFRHFTVLTKMQGLISETFQNQIIHSNTRVLEHLNISENVNITTEYSPTYDDQTVVEGKEEEMTKKNIPLKVRVLCWIMTSPENHEKKDIHVKKTWGSHCDKLIFMSSKEDKELGAIALPNVQEGRDWLWAKTKQAFKYVWEKHKDDADWFLKADDDTYVIVENLRYMLSYHDPHDPLYFGCRFKPYMKQGYMSGGAGYVLSKEALRRFVMESNSSNCREGHEGDEDVEMGKCLENLQVVAGDSRDEQGASRFHPFDTDTQINFDDVLPAWFHSYAWYPQKQLNARNIEGNMRIPIFQCSCRCATKKDPFGLNCCSNTTISFHYMSPVKMYVIEFLLYRLKPAPEIEQLQKEPFDTTHPDNKYPNENNTINNSTNSTI